MYKILYIQIIRIDIKKMVLKYFLFNWNVDELVTGYEKKVQGVRASRSDFITKLLVLFRQQCNNRQSGISCGADPNRKRIPTEKITTGAFHSFSTATATYRKNVYFPSARTNVTRNRVNTKTKYFRWFSFAYLQCYKHRVVFSEWTAREFFKHCLNWKFIRFETTFSYWNKIIKYTYN